MALFNKPTAAPMAHTLRVLARLLAYPDAELRAHLDAMQGALHAEAALDAARLAEIDALIAHLAVSPPLDIEAGYVDLFDRGRATALHLFEHVHGDSRDRGPAMVDLTQTYAQAGLRLRPGELPDHLTVVLEYASTQPPAQAAAFLAEFAHITRSIFSALLERRSPYACVLAAVLELAGEKAQPVPIAPEPALDEAWEEPLAFGGCSTEGQAAPGTPQPVRIVRRAATPSNPHAQGASA
ncbi:respiratory nitrate reductase chaperone NarJ [Variovorax sp. HW608]|uniref:nitrate reductase molybdenum cofactor assembly chaperone n=1 Tax=Variovorax sp. HW608 TaxID=1034889 RepID=UPI00081FAC2D|nr:nitrate reductase molybdenum cofactor assembly chaperone [Variovorax sp. HW608]SCK06380.1 respiratory nitrate reductase chaperone NarJ [Variovorax sp. HW608]